MEKSKRMLYLLLAGNMLLIVIYYYHKLSTNCEPCIPDMPCPPCQTSYMRNFWLYLLGYNLAFLLYFSLKKILSKPDK